MTGEVDKITFKRFERIAKEQPDLCEMIPFIAVWNGEKPDGGDPWYKDLVPNVRILLSILALPRLTTFPVQAPRAIITKTQRQSIRSFVLLLHP